MKQKKDPSDGDTPRIIKDGRVIPFITQGILDRFLKKISL